MALHKERIIAMRISTRREAAQKIPKDLVLWPYMQNKMPFYMRPKMGPPSRVLPFM
jgi:hypothetical protein